MSNVTFTCWNTHLVCENYYFKSVFLELLHFLWDALMPEDPIFCVFCEFSTRFDPDDCIVHVERSNFFWMLKALRMTDYNRFLFSPIPWGCRILLLLLFETCSFIRSFSHSAMILLIVNFMFYITVPNKSWIGQFWQNLKLTA